MAYPLFKAWMLENHITNEMLGKLLGITPGSVSQKMCGTVEFTLPQIKLICQTYGISADKFFICPKSIADETERGA